MTRRMGVIVIAAVVAGLVIWFAATAMAQSGATPSVKPARTITVSSTATVKAQPDEVVLDLRVRSESADSAAAFAQNAKDMQAVLDALKAAGITDKDVQTTIHDLSSVGSVIDAAVNAGADSVNDISFQLSNPNTIRTDALSQAVTGARSKAEALARAAGAEVVRVVTIDEQNFRPPVYNQSLEALPGAGVPTPVVPPSSLQVSVTIAVVWEIA